MHEVSSLSEVARTNASVMDEVNAEKVGESGDQPTPSQRSTAGAQSVQTGEDLLESATASEVGRVYLGACCMYGVWWVGVCRVPDDPVPRHAGAGG